MNFFRLLCVIVLRTSCALAALPSPQAVDRLLDDYFAKRPAQGFGAGLTMSEALATQSNVVARLSQAFGPRVGYKAGLANKEVQQRYGVNSPVCGVLLKGMMLKSGAAVPAQCGARPVCEADFIAVVKDEGIMRARTHLEAAQHLRAVVAFIELPDQILATNAPVDGAGLTAINVGARLGVLGERVKVQPTEEFVKALGEMAVTMTDQTGSVLGTGQGKALLEHPLNVVLWLAQELGRRGGKLKSGDLLSLGTIMKPVVPQAGQTVTVRYEGLPGSPIKVSVKFK
jgi:2-keto-4-pentenoate hydratase